MHRRRPHYIETTLQRKHSDRPNDLRDLPAPDAVTHHDRSAPGQPQ